MKTQDLRATKSSIDELCYAAHMSLRASGKTDTIFSKYMFITTFFIVYCYYKCI